MVSTITGTVSRRVLEPGEMADSGTPVMRIEDTSVLEVSAFLPAQFYAAIEPGVIADIEVLLEHARGYGVPRNAVQERGGRPVIFIVEGGTARMQPVETGLETNGRIEVRGADLRPGMPVVTMGQFMLNDGAAVSMRGEAG